MTGGAVSRETAPHRIAVIGTGTEIGKTHTAVALTAALSGRGELACGLKPIESGVVAGGRSDADCLAEVSSTPVGPAPYRFAEPVSPHLAARRAGVAISLEVVVAWVAAQPARVVVIETAGAVLSPLSSSATNLDLVRALAPAAVVLVGVDRLGVLHEVAACLLALRVLAPELPVPAVVLSEPATPDASTGTNAGELEALGIARDVVTFPRVTPTGPESLVSARRVLATVGPPSRGAPSG